MKIRLITVPHHLGSDCSREETGPHRLISEGIDEVLARAGHTVAIDEVPCKQAYPDEHSAVLEINRALAGRVRAANERREFPLVLAGNCATSLGTMACLDEDGGGILYFDAHGDFNTPETSHSGMINGMPLAIAAGMCYPDIRSVVRSRPVPETHLLLAGARDLDAGEQAALEGAGVGRISPLDIENRGARAALEPLFSRLEGTLGELYIHLDMDGVDPAEAPGVTTPTPGGFAAADVAAIIRQAGERFTVRCASVAEYYPELDDGTTMQSIFELVETLARAAAGANRTNP